MILDDLVKGLVVVERLKFVPLFDEFDWTLLEELVVKQGKKGLVVIKIHFYVGLLDL